MWVPGQPASKPAPSPVLAPTPAAGPPEAIGPVGPKDNFIAAAAYLTFLPAIIFVLIEPFKRNRFVRFHSFQSIFLAAATIVAAIAMRILYSVLALIPGLGYLLAWLTSTVALLAWVILWILLLVKALQGETFRLPWIGNLAEKI